MTAGTRVPSPHAASPDPRDGETPESWTDRLSREGAALGVRRQCSIGWHGECSSRHDGPAAECRCECHDAPPEPDSTDPAAWLHYAEEMVASGETTAEHIAEQLAAAYTAGVES